MVAPVGMSAGRGIPLAALCAVGVAVSGCGGSEQNAHEAKATYPVKIVQASFPPIQAIARNTKLVLRVRNTGTQTMPNVAVTLDSFSYVSNYPGLAANQRPVWIVNTGPGTVPKRPVQSVTVDPPGGGQTAYVNTWALGPLAPGRTRTFVWRVTPVKAGIFSVGYVVAAGLNGNAHARVSRKGALEGTGGLPLGRFRVVIAGQPPPRYVNPETGKVTHGVYVPSQYVQ
jgi:hypothetical protein